MNTQEVLMQERFFISVEESKCPGLKKFFSTESIAAVHRELGAWGTDRLLDALLQYSGITLYAN